MEIKTATWGWYPPKYELLSNNTFKIYFNPVEHEKTVTIPAIPLSAGEESEEYTEETVKYYLVNYVEKENADLLQAIKDKNTLTTSRLLLQERINAYDSSDNVNSFSINGTSIWLDKATRVGLMNSTTIQKDSGEENATLWFNGNSFTLSCDVAISMLKQLEIYALKCYNVTAEHLAKCAELTTAEELDNYGYTANYPDKLVF